MKDRSIIKLYNNENSMKLAVKFYNEAGEFLELFNKFLQKGDIESYSIILAMSKYNEFGDFIAKKKRKSDLLIEIDKEYNIYALICSETEVGGGYYFYKRLSLDLYQHTEKDIKASILSVETELDDIWEVIYDVTAPFIELGFNNLQSQDIILNRFR